jgi:hypothetical protein
MGFSPTHVHVPSCTLDNRQVKFPVPWVGLIYIDEGASISYVYIFFFVHEFDIISCNFY